MCKFSFFFCTFSHKAIDAFFQKRDKIIHILNSYYFAPFLLPGDVGVIRDFSYYVEAKYVGQLLYTQLRNIGDKFHMHKVFDSA